VTSLFRSLLVVFLLLALPFQAYAAASMRPLVAPAQLPPCHQQMAEGHMAMPAATRSDDRHDKQDQHDKHDKRKAGSCAACCVGAALASGLPVPLTLAPPRFVSIPFRAGYLPSVDPVLPERPPSTLPA
jgi:hypothetical protein